MDITKITIPVSTIITVEVSSQELVSKIVERGVDFALEFLKELDFQMDHETFTKEALSYFQQEAE